ncbi:MAG: hypothetical protein ACK5XN_22280 [Bacteroidota bacterium]
MIAWLVFINLAHAERVKVPVYFDGVYPDPGQNSKSDYYHYEVKGQLSEVRIQPRDSANSTVEELTASAIQALVSNDQAKYKALYSEQGQKVLAQKGQDSFDYLWKQFKPQSSYVMSWYFYHKKGVIVSWRGKENPSPTYFYAEKKNDRWRMEYFFADESDITFNNVMLYLNYAPLEIKTATVLKDFRLSDSELTTLFEANLPHLYVLLKTKERWELFTYLQDNQTERVRYRDREPAKGLVKLEFAKEELPAGTNYEMLIVQSRFPIRNFPHSLFEKGQLKF